MRARGFGVVCVLRSILFFCLFFFNDTATTEIYPLSLHDALPIWPCDARGRDSRAAILFRTAPRAGARGLALPRDRKSTRLNSSHQIISYAVFCLKKKKSPLQPHCPPSATHTYYTPSLCRLHVKES